MNLIKRNYGVTMIALVLTIIVLFIIASISLYEGKNIVQNSRVENYLTNMMSIKAKAKVMAEEVNSQVWNISDAEEKKNQRKEILKADPYFMTVPQHLEYVTQIEQVDSDVKAEGYEYYSMTDKTLEYMKLSGIGSGNNYVIVYNSEDYTKLDVVYVLGIKYNDNIYYTLSALQEARGVD